MKRTITEKFDDKGNLTERVTVEEDSPAVPYIPPQPYVPAPTWAPAPVYSPWDGSWVTTTTSGYISLDPDNQSPVTFTAS